MMIAEIPVALICFTSVSSPAENIIRITPISAMKLMPSIAVELKIGSFGIKVIRPSNIPVRSIPTTCGRPIFLQPILNNLDTNKIKAKGNKTSKAFIPCEASKNITLTFPFKKTILLYHYLSKWCIENVFIFFI